MIDIDKVKKLIKLANNNPNDNEANSAARLVCKLLADYKFEQVKIASDKFSQGMWNNPQSQGTNMATNIVFEDVINMMNDLKRKAQKYNQTLICSKCGSPNKCGPYCYNCGLAL